MLCSLTASIHHKTLKVCRNLYTLFQASISEPKPRKLTSKWLSLIAHQQTRSFAFLVGFIIPSVSLMATASSSSLYLQAPLGLSLARAQYLNLYGVFCGDRNRGMNQAAPGECYYYLMDHYRTGIMIHLFTIVSAGFLVIFQFVPAIRHKAILVHRVNGSVKSKSCPYGF
jgi:hypothetical protein